MTPEERYIQLYREMHDLCQQQGWGDPFSYARSREIYLAGVLGHSVASTYSGADAVTEDGTLAEYKTTINKRITATYNGISVQDTWEDQEQYLVEDKIGKYDEHYVARFDGSEIAELWMAKGDDVLAVLLPKVQKQYPKKKNGNAKDPRIGVTLSSREIRTIGQRVM